MGYNMEDGITKIELQAGEVHTTVFEAVIAGKINTVVINDHGVTVTLFNGDQLFISKFTMLKLGLLVTGALLFIIQKFIKPKDNE